MAEDGEKGGVPPQSLPPQPPVTPASPAKGYTKPAKAGPASYELKERPEVANPGLGLDPRLQGALMKFKVEAQTQEVAKEVKGAVSFTRRSDFDRKPEAPPTGPENPYVDVLALLKEPMASEELRKKLPELVVFCQIGRVCTGSVKLNDILKLRQKVQSLKAATELRLQLKSSVPEIHCTAGELDPLLPPNGLDGSDVIVGIVDRGCDFAHRNFRDKWGYTRLLYLWDQRTPPNPKPDDHPPRDFLYGREFDSARINGALLQTDPDPYVDLDYPLEAASHGTHVMDIAAGNGRGTGLDRAGVAPYADLIFVELAEGDEKQELIARKFGTEEHLGNSRYLLEAVAYIFRKAKQLRRPCVVNLSLGTYGGPHDGTTLVEKGFEELLKEPKQPTEKGRAIVIAAGNAGRQAIHASGIVQKGSAKTLVWKFHDDLLKGSEEELEIWYTPRTDDPKKGLKVTLIPPGKKRLIGVSPGESYELLDGASCGYVIHRAHDPNHGPSNRANQVNIRVPVVKDSKDKAKAWKIELSTEDEQIDFDAWIDDGSHSELADPDPARTLGAICCGASTIGVGAYDARTPNAVLAAVTSQGPTRDGRPKPEVSAPGARVCAASARTHGALLELSGTSMSAPHVTGLVALLFELDGNLSVEELSKILTSTVRKAPAQKNGWDPHYGFGRIDGLAAAQAVQARSR